jgi:cellulose synthase/poly-beta-1,6-N-acetylglucosamine synthase-like glycosyltransferase
VANCYIIEKGAMKKTLPKVTIAVSAFNEEDNVVSFFKSVLKQKETGFVIDKIWFYSDGSTDRTVERVLNLRSKKIQIFDDKKRIGKSSRLNQIYQRLNTEYLVQTDADVVFAHQHVVRDLLAPLLADKRVGMCGGHPQPTQGITFTEKAVNLTFETYAPLRKLGNRAESDNVYSVDGRILAYRKSVVKKIFVPKNMIANDAFTYYSCLTQGCIYKYVPTAIVLFRSPQTMADQIRQNTRFVAAPIRMTKYFSKEIVESQRVVPKGLMIKLQLLQFIKHPILCSYIFAINSYCKFGAKKAEQTMTAKWSIAGSTKKFGTA